MNEAQVRVAVIMAGGSGERFWPLSRRRRPKQLLKLASADRTLLEESIARITPLIPPERIFIATSRALIDPIRNARTGVPEANVIGEPAKRNTAGALAWATACVRARFPGIPPARISLAILTADHRIDSGRRFLQTAEAALRAAEEHAALATIGIVPDRPETGFGYIEIPEGAQSVLTGDGVAAGDERDLPPVYPVLRFREKPDLAAAREYLATGRFFWNSGMFFWRLDTFLDEISHSSPIHAAAIHSLTEALANGAENGAEEVFDKLPDISVDYALMEKARRVVVARATFGWDDVGAWDALERGYPHDAQGNITSGDPVLIDTQNSIVVNEPGARKMAVAVVGVDGLAVVVTADGVLVVPKSRAQDVKLAVNELKKRGAPQI